MADDERRISGQSGVIDQLERLSALLANGTVTRAEFDEQKSRILVAANHADVAPANRIDERDRSENAGTRVSQRGSGPAGVR